MLPGWLEHYNAARPHLSLGGRPPLNRLPGVNNLMLAHIQPDGMFWASGRQS